MNKKQINKKSKIKPITTSIKSSKSQKKKIWKIFWIIIGYISSILTILVFAYQLGQYKGYRQARQDQLKNFSDYLKVIKNGIRITQALCDKNVLWQGDSCELSITIENSTSYECSFWLGASAIGPGGNELWNVAEDQQITVFPAGPNMVKRKFTFSKDAPIGKYDILIKLWYGKISDPKQSECISNAMLRQQVLVMQR